MRQLLQGEMIRIKCYYHSCNIQYVFEDTLKSGGIF